MSEPVRIYALPFDVVRRPLTAARALALRDAVQHAVHDVKPCVDRYLQGGAILDPNDTVPILETLAMSIGRRLPSTLAGGVSISCLEEVDKVLLAARFAAPFSMVALVFGGSFATDLPFPSEKPSVGYIEPGVLAAVAEQFRDSPPTADDAGVDEVLSQLDDWLTLTVRWQSDFATPLGLLGTYG